MVGPGILDYDCLQVQPGEYTAGELDWKYDFEIEIVFDTGLLREYVVFVFSTDSLSDSNNQAIHRLRRDLNQSLIKSDVPYAFEDTSGEFSVRISHSLVQKAIIDFRNEAEGNLGLAFGESFIDSVEEQYTERVRFSPDEKIPGPTVPPKSRALCSECGGKLHVHIYEDKQNQMHCFDCEKDCSDPTEWIWKFPDPHPSYTGDIAEEQDPDHAGCPNCGSWLFVYEHGTVGVCRNCDGIYPKGTWHMYEPVSKENAACPGCGSRLNDFRGNFGACYNCSEPVEQRDWIEYDPAADLLSFPAEVKPGIIQVSERKYRVEKTGHTVDSLWEADIDMRLAEAVQNHEREPEQFKIKNGYYWPDFRVNDIVIEIKGIRHEKMLSDAVSKAESFREHHPNLTYVVIGDKSTKEIPADQWFLYPSECSKAVKWIKQELEKNKGQ